MRAKPRVVAAFAAAVVVTGLSSGAAAQAGTQIPSGLVTPASVQQLQSDATTLDNASTDAARTAGLAQQALAAAKAAAIAAADKAAQTHDPADIAAAAAASAAQAAAQVDYDTKSATAAKAAADAAAAADNLAKEKTSLNGSESGKGGVNGGTSTESAATLPDPDPFPDNYLHSPNVQLISHVRGTIGADPSCPAFNPTKCPGFSSLNFLHYENLGYDLMVANGTGGLSVWSLKDPAHPKYISTVPVAQLNAVSGAADTRFWEGENETVDSARKIVFMCRTSEQGPLRHRPEGPLAPEDHRFPEGLRRATR